MDNKTYLDNAHARDKAEWKSADAGTRIVNDSEPIKMLYVRHKLGKNYLSANGTGDENMKKEILTGEIAKLIVYQPDTIVSLLSKNRIKASSRSNSGLVAAVSDGLYSNRRFAQDIAIEIAKNRGNDGTYAADEKTANTADTLGAAASLVKGLGDLFGGKKKATASTKKAQAEAEKAKADAAKALAEATKAHAQGSGISNKITYYIIGSVLAASAIVAGIWYYNNKTRIGA